MWLQKQEKEEKYNIVSCEKESRYVQGNLCIFFQGKEEEAKSRFQATRNLFLLELGASNS